MFPKIMSKRHFTNLPAKIRNRAYSLNRYPLQGLITYEIKRNHELNLSLHNQTLSVLQCLKEAMMNLVNDRKLFPFQDSNWLPSEYKLVK